MVSPPSGGGNSSKDPPRKPRQYPDKAKGPFIVLIRELEVPLNPIRISVHVHRQYKSVKSIMKTSPGKIKVVLDSIADANAMPTDDFFKAYRVFIPEESVEVIGVIEYPITENLSELMASGRGKFLNPNIPAVEIVGVRRISITAKESTAAPGENSGTPDEASGGPTEKEAAMELGNQHNDRIVTPLVRVHFVGTVLPDRVEIFGLLIKVRINRTNPMFCEKCQHYGHTLKFCKNGLRCNKCGQKHNSSDCSIPVVQCLNCKVSGHATGSPSCPFLEALRFKSTTKVINNRKKTFAEIVQAPSNNHTVSAPQPYMFRPQTNSPSVSASQPIIFTPQANSKFSSSLPSTSAGAPLSTKNTKFMDFSKRTTNTSNKSHTHRAPKRRRSRSPEGTASHVRTSGGQAKTVPPGFRSTSSSSSCAAFIQKLCQSLKLSPFWLNIVNQIIIPLMETIFSKIPSFISPLLATLNLSDV